LPETEILMGISYLNRLQWTLRKTRDINRDIVRFTMSRILHPEAEELFR
jgi:hypothetical protein